MAGAPAPPFRTQPRTPRNLTPVVSTCVVRPGRLGLGPDWRAGDSILGQPRFAFTRPAANPDNGATRSGAARAAMPAPPPTLLASWRLNPFPLARCDESRAADGQGEEPARGAPRALR